MTYDDDVQLRTDQRGDFVFSWLRGAGAVPIRVQASRADVQDQWGKDWQHVDSVKAEFRRRRSEWIKQAEADAIVDDAGIRVFTAH